MKRRHCLVVLVTGAIALSSCNGGTTQNDGVTTVSATSTPTTGSSGATAISATGARLTTAQALVLSRMLLKDQEAGGADLSVIAAAGTMQAFELRGQVNWADHQGSVMLHAPGTGAVQADEALVWSQGQLLLRVPGLDGAMAAKGRPGIAFASRPLQAGSSTVDQVIVLVASLGNDRAENPILLRQADTGYLGRAEINGVSHDRFRYGSTVYWVDSSGRIARVEAKFASTKGTVVVDLRSHGPRHVDVPAPSAVVPASEISDVLAALARS